MNLKYNKCLSNKRIINATLDKCNLKIDSEVKHILYVIYKIF